MVTRSGVPRESRYVSDNPRVSKIGRLVGRWILSFLNSTVDQFALGGKFKIDLSVVIRNLSLAEQKNKRPDEFD